MRILEHYGEIDMFGDRSRVSATNKQVFENTHFYRVSFPYPDESNVTMTLNTVGKILDLSPIQFSYQSTPYI